MDDKSAEERIAALEAELAALRKPQPKPESLYRELPGQAGLFDRSGNRVQLPEAVPASTTVGSGGGFGSTYRTYDDGTRQYAPDGVPRDPRTGEPLSGVSPRGAGPQRSVQHQLAVEQLDKAFPIHKPTPIEE